MKPRKIKPVGFESILPEVEPPDNLFERVETEGIEIISSRIEERIAQRIRRRTRRERINTALLILLDIGSEIPIVQKITNPIRRHIMPKKTAKEFFQKFQAAEGRKKWVYLGGAILVLAAGSFSPETIPYVIGAVFAVEAFIAKYEESIAKEQS